MPTPPFATVVNSAPLKAELKLQAQLTLQALAGPEARLRPDQWQAIEGLVAGRRALVVQRTGWGKSAVYFVATALLRAAGAGPTVIVSPLLALMRNQIEAAARAGIRAATINSTNIEDWRRTYAEIGRGEIDVLLLSPERLNNPEFRDQVLPALAASCGLLVVDEAHCISDWGHDFRPDFRRLRTLLTELPAGIGVLATTATANSRVVADITEVLGLGGDGNGVLVLRGSLDRTSLRLGVLRLPSPAHRLAWLADQLPKLAGSGIVYALTVAGTEEIADYLRGAGLAVAAYSGQTEPSERLAAEQDLLTNRVKALVATSALGMGFDKPDLGFVIHVGAPSSPIAYYQQIGRAGRGVEDAQVVLLPGAEDEAIWSYFASLGFPAEAQVHRTLEILNRAPGPVSTAALETQIELSRNRLETMLKVLDVDGAASRVKGGWIGTGQAWSYDAERYRRVAAARKAEQQAMRDYQATTDCRLRFLRDQLDDNGAGDCGRCDNCGGLSLAGSVSPVALSRANGALSVPGVPFEPRKLWPSGMPAIGIAVKGRLAAGETAETGRAIARFTDLGQGALIRATVQAVEDGAVSTDLVQAAVAVLASWGWSNRPNAVVHVGSLARPELLASFAAKISELGRMPNLGSVPHLATGPAPASSPASRSTEVHPAEVVSSELQVSPLRVTGRTNSAQRLRQVWDAYRVPSELADALSGGLRGRAVLLLDDYTATGWTLTVVALLLRQAGAGSVYPFVFGIAG